MLEDELNAARVVHTNILAQNAARGVTLLEVTRTASTGVDRNGYQQLISQAADNAARGVLCLQ